MQFYKGHQEIVARAAEGAAKSTAPTRQWLETIAEEPLDLAAELQKREKTLRTALKSDALSRVQGEGRLTWKGFVADMEQDADEKRARKMRRRTIISEQARQN